MYDFHRCCLARWINNEFCNIWLLPVAIRSATLVVKIDLGHLLM